MTYRVTVIDDDPSILAVVTDVLRDEGYEVDAHLNSVDALRAVTERTPHLVLLDMRMPVMDGWQFTRQLRERGIEVPIVVMTAAQDARAWAEEVGAVGYISKPFDIDHLLAEVERAVTPKGSQMNFASAVGRVVAFPPRLRPAGIGAAARLSCC